MLFILLIIVVVTFVYEYRQSNRYASKAEAEKPYAYSDILHLWEDDYLMIELFHRDNLNFILTETERIRDFGNEHRADYGFTDVTVIGDKPVPLSEKQIRYQDIENIILNEKLEKIDRFHMQDIGLLEGDKAPLGFGSNKFAILPEQKDGIIQNISFTGRFSNEEEKDKTVKILKTLAANFDLMGVNWYKDTYYPLDTEESIIEFTNSF